MAVTGKWVTDTHVTQRIGPDALRRLCDDDRNGAADDAVVQALIDEQEAIVWAAAVTEYPAESLPETPAAASQTKGGILLRSITLKLIQGEIYDRYPEYARADGSSIRSEAMKLVDMLARAKLRLDGITVEPANVGGETVAFDETLEDPPRFWTGDGGTGIF